MIDIVFSPILVKKFASFTFYFLRNQRKKTFCFFDKNIGLEWSGGLKYDMKQNLRFFGILEFLNFFHFL